MNSISGLCVFNLLVKTWIDLCAFLTSTKAVPPLSKGVKISMHSFKAAMASSYPYYLSSYSFYLLILVAIVSSVSLAFLSKAAFVLTIAYYKSALNGNKTSVNYY